MLPRKISRNNRCRPVPSRRPDLAGCLTYDIRHIYANSRFLLKSCHSITLAGRNGDGLHRERALDW